MATEVKVIKVRRGPYTDFDKTKMNAGEPAITTSGDPNALDGKGVYMGVGPGQVKQVAMIEDIEDILNAAVDGAVDEATQQAEAEADRAAAAATQLSSTVTQVATNTANISELNERIDNERLSEDAKVALLNCFAHIAWIDEHGQDYYDTLEDALYPETGLVRITAVFTQGSTVIYPTTPLNDLKAYLVVTGHYNNGTSKTITDYALTGTLEVGTSTITALKNGKYTTFDVVVTQIYWDYEWNASSSVVPQGMSTSAYNFTYEEGAMFCESPNLNFGHFGDCEIEVTMKFAGYGEYISQENISNPQIMIVNHVNSKDLHDGAKVWGYIDNGSSYIKTNVSGTSEIIEINQSLYHIYKLRFENGIATLTVDGEVLKSGSGVTNNRYLEFTGITSNGATTYVFIKSIKFKKLGNSQVPVICLNKYGVGVYTGTHENEFCLITPRDLRAVIVTQANSPRLLTKTTTASQPTGNINCMPFRIPQNATNIVYRFGTSGWSNVNILTLDENTGIYTRIASIGKGSFTGGEDITVSVAGYNDGNYFAVPFANDSEQDPSAVNCYFTYD